MNVKGVLLKILAKQRLTVAQSAWYFNAIRGMRC